MADTFDIFNPTEEHKQLRETVHRFGETELEPQADDGWKDRYHTRRTEFLAAYEDYRQAHEAQIAADRAADAAFR